jgi:hypothetical protein
MKIFICSLIDIEIWVSCCISPFFQTTFITYETKPFNFKMHKNPYVDDDNESLEFLFLKNYVVM